MIGTSLIHVFNRVTLYHGHVIGIKTRNIGYLLEQVFPFRNIIIPFTSYFTLKAMSMLLVFSFMGLTHCLAQRISKQCNVIQQLRLSVVDVAAVGTIHCLSIGLIISLTLLVILIYYCNDSD